jgi:hypothetical protein
MDVHVVGCDPQQTEETAAGQESSYWQREAHQYAVFLVIIHLECLITFGMLIIATNCVVNY